MNRPEKPQPTQRLNQNMQNMQYQQQMMNQQMANQQMANQQMVNQQNMQMKPKKKMNKVVLVLIIVVAIALIAGLVYLVMQIASARISSRVVELEGQVAQLEQTIENNEEAHRQKVEELNQAIADTTVKEVVPTTSLQRVEGSEVPEFWLVEGDFIAPNSLDIPNASDSVNDSYVQIGQRFTFRPSDRWILTSQGSTYEFSHPQKIWGKIRALSVKELVPEAEMKDLIQGFFIGYPATEITYRKVFIEDRVVGMLGRAPITVKYTDTDGSTELEKEMIVNVGFVERADFALSFLFVYDAEGGSTSQELIDLLLRSGTFGANGSAIKLE